MIIKPQVTNENEFGLSSLQTQMAKQKSIASTVFEYMDDFVLEANSGDDLTRRYVVTQLTGGGAVTHEAANGGVILIDAGNASDNNGVGSAQPDSNGIVVPAAGRNIYCEMRVERTVQSGGQFFGLGEVDTTFVTASHLGAPAIGFVCDAGSSAITVLDTVTTTTATANDSETVTAGVVTGMSDADKFRTYGIEIIGTGEVRFYVDRSLVATHTANISTNALVPSFASVNSTTTRSKLKVDYVYIVSDR